MYEINTTKHIAAANKTTHQNTPLIITPPPRLLPPFLPSHTVSVLAYQYVGLGSACGDGVVVLVGFDVFTSGAEVEEVGHDGEGEQHDTPEARLAVHTTATGRCEHGL